MKTDPHLPTQADINALVSFLPRLYAPGFEPVLRWEGGEKDTTGAIQMPYPIYDPLVNEFMRAVSSGGWLDTRYLPEQAYAMLKDDQVIASADVSKIKSMLTFVVRGERFSDGHWGEMITQGYVRKLLERLGELG